MKKVIFSLLILVMMLPGLACANIMSHAPAKHMVGMLNCPGMNHKSTSQGIALFKDCSKADLQKVSDGSVLKKPVFAKEGFFTPSLISSLNFYPVRQAFYPTGPPFVRLTENLTYPPILLTVPRLRI